MSTKKGHDWYFCIEVGQATLMVTAHFLSATLCQFWWAVEVEISKTSTAKVCGWYGTSGTSKDKKRVSSPSPMQRAEGGCQCCCLAVGLSCECAELQLTTQELPCFDSVSDKNGELLLPLASQKHWEEEDGIRSRGRTHLSFAFLLRYFQNPKIKMWFQAPLMDSPFHQMQLVIYVGTRTCGFGSSFTANYISLSGFLGLNSA